jgi:hypothetical protein
MIFDEQIIRRRTEGGLYAEVALASLGRGITTTARVVVLAGCWGCYFLRAGICTRADPDEDVAEPQESCVSRTPACSWKRVA